MPSLAANDPCHVLYDLSLKGLERGEAFQDGVQPPNLVKPPPLVS